jgi:hypothetical protein
VKEKGERQKLKVKFTLKKNAMHAKRAKIKPKGCVRIKFRLTAGREKIA